MPTKPENSSIGESTCFDESNETSKTNDDVPKSIISSNSPEYDISCSHGNVYKGVKLVTEYFNNSEISCKNVDNKINTSTSSEILLCDRLCNEMSISSSSEILICDRVDDKKGIANKSEISPNRLDDEKSIYTSSETMNNNEKIDNFDVNSPNKDFENINGNIDCKNSILDVIDNVADNCIEENGSKNHIRSDQLTESTAILESKSEQKYNAENNENHSKPVEIEPIVSSSEVYADSMFFGDKLYRKNLAGVAEMIKDGLCKNIVIMCGAGISTSTGIPDFRSPDSGIFSNLVKYNLPYPEMLFQLDYFRRNPLPFYDFMYSMSKCVIDSRPSVTHYFMSFLASRNLIRRTYTQNIDNLELKASFPENLLIQAHGSYSTARCIDCNRFINKEEFDDMINNNNTEREPIFCEYCRGLIKPNIIFYGENLPDQFFETCCNDMEECDLLIIIGTSLKVEPFSSLRELVPMNTPRLLINDRSVRSFVLDFDEFRSSEKDYYNPIANDIFHMGDCDVAVTKFIDLLGLHNEFEQYMQSLKSKSSQKN